MADSGAFLTYRFTLDDGKAMEFPVRLDPETLDAAPQERPSYPEWTLLSSCRCPNCPLPEGPDRRCPAAERVVDIVGAFKDSASTEVALVEVVRDARRFSKRTTLAEGVSALLGVIMPTSGCPILGKLKPNVLTHIPFSTIQETIFRTLALYLFAQFLIQRRGGRPDWKIEGLAGLIEDIHTVNRHFSDRFFQCCLKDVNVNALVHLDSFAELTAMATQRSERRLDELEKLFSAYMARVPGLTPGPRPQSKPGAWA
ncbi:MAG: hypothetical protein HY748_08575 [Elusimicrobia bacterium]|nr:hypothetical protein [Elusimicrobiota bacterium]